MRLLVGGVDAAAGGVLVGCERVLWEADDGREGLCLGEGWTKARKRLGDAVVRGACLDGSLVSISAEPGSAMTYLRKDGLLNTHVRRLEIRHFVHGDSC